GRDIGDNGGSMDDGNKMGKPPEDASKINDLTKQVWEQTLEDNGTETLHRNVLYRELRKTYWLLAAAVSPRGTAGSEPSSCAFCGYLERFLVLSCFLSRTFPCLYLSVSLSFTRQCKNSRMSQASLIGFRRSNRSFLVRSVPTSICRAKQRLYVCIVSLLSL